MTAPSRLLDPVRDDLARRYLELALTELEHLDSAHVRTRYHTREALQHIHAAKEVTSDE